MSANTIGPYRVLEPLGQGGMGVVYRAAHQTTGQIVALKTVRIPNASLLDSIRREIQTLSRLSHPGIVRVLEEGLHQGMPFYAMELLQGQTLRQWRASAPPQDHPSNLWWTQTLALPPSAQAPSLLPTQQGSGSALTSEGLREVLTLVRGLCASLAFLHGEGIIHRDLKPENVVVVEEKVGNREDPGRRLMGEDSSRFPAFPNYSWYVSDLLEDWRGEAVSYDTDRYIKVAINVDKSAVSPPDYFLDLSRSDGEDAPLVCFEDLFEEDGPEGPHRLEIGEWSEVHEVLRTWLCAQAFHFFELMRRAEVAHCGFYTGKRTPREAWSVLCQALERFSWDQPLHAADSWFGVSPEVSLFTVFMGDSVFVRLGANSKAELQRVVNELRRTLKPISVEAVPRQESPTILWF